MDILFAMNNFEELGIQKVICTILNEWDSELGEVALSVHNKKGKFSSHWKEKCKVYELEKDYSLRFPFHFLSHTIGYYRLLKKIRPKKVIAVNQGEAMSLCLVKRFYKNFKLVVCEHCNITYSINDYCGWFGWYYRHFFQREYKKYADVIHTVSHESKEDMVRNWGFNERDIVVIYNPVMIPTEDIPVKVHNERFVIAVASRLEQQKRVDILLRGLFLLKQYNEKAFSCIQVIIMGDGSLRKQLEIQCNNLGLEENVTFSGFVKEPWRIVATADLFVSTSEWEGLSVSLIEAQTVHTPILASNCPSGNKEILLYGKAGKLFERNNPEDFARQLLDILLYPDQLKEYVKEADEALDRFSLTLISKQYANI